MGPRVRGSIATPLATRFTVSEVKHVIDPTTGGA